MNDPIMSIRDVAQVLKLAEKTVYAMATDGDLPAFKIRGQWRLRRVDFEIWLAIQASGVSLSQSSVPATQVDAAEAPRAMALAENKEGRKMAERQKAVSDITERVAQDELHYRFVKALGPEIVKSHADFTEKPFVMELKPPLPQRVRLYIYNATRPPGGRPQGEHKIQLILPGQSRGQRASFDNGDGRIVLLAGYAAEEDIFILWDADLYTDFAWSRNVQVKVETILEACAGKIATQARQLRPPGGAAVFETVLATQPRMLAEAIEKRMKLTIDRLTGE